MPAALLMGPHTVTECDRVVLCCCRIEVERRTHPLSKADFVLLESELETWRQQQPAAIKQAGLVQQEEQVGALARRRTVNSCCSSSSHIIPVHLFNITKGLGHCCKRAGATSVGHDETVCMWMAC